MDSKTLFTQLFAAQNESEVEALIAKNSDVFANKNWKPIGGNDNNYGIIKNQQANPIAALVEKVTNAMDAILMKKCQEARVDAKSSDAPQSMEEAIGRFFPNHKNWDIATDRRRQAEEIQVLADGKPRDVSVVIYDNGEGQHPQDFERTFLSLVRGNKNEIMFVQGKYNMGGAGAIVFCGKRGYQLIASRKADKTGRFGFTLTRERAVPEGGPKDRKDTWYEYLTINGEIPSFELNGPLDLKLHNRQFETGSIIKLYSYQFPPGYYGFAQDLNQSFNEFLFEPVLPLLTVESKERYPNNKVLELDLFGLKRRLEEDKSDYLDVTFSERYRDELFGEMNVTCYVFKPKVEKHDVKATKEAIQRRYFKNNMSVMFSLNGQVHGHYTSEFITRQLKLNLLKDYLLIHVDCTKMKYAFRKELFMASRDRLKQGDEANELREYLGRNLRKGRLDEINKRRKESIGLESEDTNELLKSFAKNLPKDSDLFKLLQNTLKLEEKKEDPKKGKEEKKPAKQKEEREPFHPKRFPTIFKVQRKDSGTSVVSVPMGGEKTLKFETDVENNYFHRSEEPGELQIALLDIKRNGGGGGDKPGTEKEVADLLNIRTSSPNEGTIRISFNPTHDAQVGDEVQLKVSLTTPGDAIDEVIWVKIKDAEAPKVDAPKPEEEPEQIGLPELVRIKREQWDSLETAGIKMDYDTVMNLVGEGDKLEKIYVNLDSRVLLSHKSKLKSEDQLQVSEKKYLASVYFHTLFLYMITKRRNYKLSKEINGKDDDVTIDDYIRDVFDSYYSDFLLNFGMEQLISSLE